MLEVAQTTNSRRNQNIVFW